MPESSRFIICFDSNMGGITAGRTVMERDETRTGQPRFRVGVFAVIEGDGRYLLARRADIGWWNLPGGGLEYDETVEEGLAREVREEIGAEIEIIRLVGVYSKPRKREIVLSFLCHLAASSPEPTTSDEICEVGWFAPGALPDRVLPKHRQRVEDALLDQPMALIRTQGTSTEEDQRLGPSHLA
jgi:ADP-ribose pyrophosphatase YjhB (NUDIX family)